MRCLLTAVLLLFLAPPSVVAAEEPEEPGAFELLDRLRTAYERLELYADRGEIEVVHRNSAEAAAERFAFRTWKLAPDSLRFEIDRRHTLWSDAGGAYIFDRQAGEARDVAGLTAELQRLAEVDGAALLVPALLVAGGSGLGDPEVASVAGRESCGESACWVLEMSSGNGILHYRLSVDSASSLIRRMELELRDPGQVVARALAPAAGDAASPATTIVRVSYAIEADPQRPAVASAVAFRPPAGIPWIESRPAGVDRAAAGEADDPDSRAAELAARGGFGESLTVRLATISLRAIDSKGRPIEDLRPEDFVLEIGGERLAVESVDWVSSRRHPLAELPPAERVAADILLPPPGKLVVLFVQSDMQALRVKGHLKMLDEIPGLLATLGRDDRVAVVSFDSHLKLRLDFTRDASRAEEAVFDGIRGAAGGWPAADRPPSLARHLDRHLADLAATPERALELTADALAAAGEQEKVVVFLGWGLGRFGAFGVSRTYAFRQAEAALQRAGIPLFVLDITDADYHTLEVALAEIAWATGGDYIKTHLFPAQAANRIAATLIGHYRLYYTPPESTSGKGRVKVRLAARQGTVLIASSPPG